MLSTEVLAFVAGLGTAIIFKAGEANRFSDSTVATSIFTGSPQTRHSHVEVGSKQDGETKA